MYRTIQSKRREYTSMNNPTTQTYTSLTTAYDFFNRELFGGGLPPCLITMQRHKGAFGYFSGERFANTSNPKEVTDEIALNPAHFATRKPVEVLSTLAHEMVHLWQHHYGEPPRKGYHDKQWAAKMREIGLIPSSSGEEGGKETGQKMTHFIEKNGRYARAVSKLLIEHPAILYHDRTDDNDPTRKKKSASKTKYTCPGCGLNAWAKPEAPLICGNCQEPMQAENVEGEEDE
ncbi:MAG TPA: SprT-like domain-containing protein [Methylomirabilota bacterium]|nr:SprT-like domain-containing protein [Methylomirabilota bacterium]